MPEDLFIQIDARRTIWLMEISRQTFEDQRLDDLESDGGLFLILEDDKDNRFQVLAKVASVSAGRSLLELFAASYTVKAA